MHTSANSSNVAVELMRLFHTQTNSGVFSTSGSGSTWMSGSRSVDSGGIGVVGRDGNSGVVLSRSSS